MDPLKKKQISYRKDRINTYGENDKSSRKSIRFRKRWINHVNRRKARYITRTLDLETGDSDNHRSTRKRWAKSPDTPLGYVLQVKANRRIIDDLTDLYKEDESSLDLLHEELIKSGINEFGAEITIRKLRSYIICPRAFYNMKMRFLDKTMASNIIAFLDRYRTPDG